jgi:hypothetical protein
MINEELIEQIKAMSPERLAELFREHSPERLGELVRKFAAPPAFPDMTPAEIAKGLFEDMTPEELATMDRLFWLTPASTSSPAPEVKAATPPEKTKRSIGFELPGQSDKSK